MNTLTETDKSSVSIERKEGEKASIDGDAMNIDSGGEEAIDRSRSITVVRKATGGDPTPWSIVTRGKANGQKAKKQSTIKIGTPTPFQAKNNEEIPRKRHAKGHLPDNKGDSNMSGTTQFRSLEESMAAVLRAAIQEITSKQSQQLQEITMKLQEMDERTTKKIEKLEETIQFLLRNQPVNVRENLSYSEAIKTKTTEGPAPANITTNRPTQQLNDGLKPKDKPKDDKCMITIDTARTKAEKEDHIQVKENLQKSISGYKVVEGCKIKCLRPFPGLKIGVVFDTAANAEKARKHHSWLSTAMPGARLKTEEWYPVKFDGVAKDVVLDKESQGGNLLKKDVGQNFAADNSTKDTDYTVMMARWLSKPDNKKKTGSIVLWLKEKDTANKLLHDGTALFGPTDAFATQWERSIDERPCFKCNTYGHKQFNCRSQQRCGKCSGNHHIRDCVGTPQLKCPACTGPHAVTDRRCKRHPRHLSPSPTDSSRSDSGISLPSTQTSIDLTVLREAEKGAVSALTANQIVTTSFMAGWTGKFLAEEATAKSGEGKE